ncbi:MAG: hypothetical protein KGL39_53560, partial [Patescibacteria group bacterium]|nr:hypothetical protein [Patescibacteria group bacterium]
MPLLANAGLLWLAPVIINMLFSAGSDDVDHQMTQFLGDSYHRWQPRLPRSFPLDDATPHGLMDLRFAAANASRSAITVFNRFLSDAAH